MKKFWIGSLVIVLCSVGAQAQRYFGIATSNWSGNNALYLNPANIADNRNKFSIDLLSFNIGVDNDLGTINTDKVLKQFVKGDSIGLNKVFNVTNKGSFNMLAPSAEVRLPGFMFSINHRNSIALTMRIRAMNQFSNFDQTLFRVLSGANTINVTQTTALVDLRDFRWMLHAWSQVSATYGRVLLERKKHQIKAGVTVSYLGGIAYAGFKGNQLSAQYNVYKTGALPDSTTIDVQSSDVAYASNVLKSADELQNGISSVDIANYFFGKKGGIGWGADVGLVYEFRPGYPDKYSYEMDGMMRMDYRKNMYKVRVSAAVTDIGSVLYDKNNLTANMNGTGHLSSNDPATNFNNFSDVRNYTISHGFNLDTSSAKSTRVYLPTALIASIDYKIGWRFYLNATYLADLTDHKNFGNNYYNQVTVTPRYDSRGASLAVPITYSTLTNKIKAGVGLRIFGGFFVGSDDVLAAVNSDQTGMNVYFGVFAPVNKKKVKDRDKDKVSDKMDQCPSIPGQLSAHGCPDKDRDGVADMDDRCPNDSGLVELQGCPDRDDDGIADIDDKCPDATGVEQFGGCPDTDKDGVPDNEDLCPAKAGSVQYHGCPDTDNDGIPDNEDKCPDAPGLPSNHGCPAESKTQKVNAVERSMPVTKEDAKVKVARAAQALEFETGRAVIKKVSFASLNEVVKVMKANPSSSMTIDGYTDNTGDAAKNTRLSKARADAVKSYLVKRGIKVTRLKSAGHGDSNPIDNNSTPEGRAKNRRVEMNLQGIDK